MTKSSKLLTAALVVLVLAAAAFIALRAFPGEAQAGGSMAGTVLTLHQQADGSLLLTWPEQAGAEGYLVQVLPMPEDAAADAAAEAEAVPLYSAETVRAECMLPAELPQDTPVVLSVTSRRQVRALFTGKLSTRESSAAVACYLNHPEIFDLTWYTDPDADTLFVEWAGWQGDVFHIYLQQPDGTIRPFREVDGVTAALTFGEGADLEMPAPGEETRFVLDAMRAQTGLNFYGKLSQVISVAREDFLDTAVTVECADEGDNSYCLTWNETQGDRYQVQAYDPITRRWDTVAELDRGAERVYHTGRLGSYRDYTLRVRALGGRNAAENQEAAAPGEVMLHTGASVKYATVWPIQDLAVYADAAKRTRSGTARAGAALCVVGEEGGMFRIRWAGGYAYLDSGYCMINLPDYLGDLCSYDITNSYASIYMVHEFVIPAVTGTVISGYEQVRTADGAYLVPLLYPAAKKLHTAALAAGEDGYRLKIYDSFRPGKATRAIYDLTEAVLDDPVPASTWNREPLYDLPAAQPPEQRLTYLRVMTSGGYNLNSFLANGGSMHNYGVAMDLTLETAEAREELRMQTRLHDLSWYSVLGRNTDTANLLDGYMKAAGFGGLVSEWWHFQDNEAIAALHPSALWEGVSPQGWKGDDGGWRYLGADGVFYRDTRAVIDGVEYVFGEDGYVTQ